MKSLKELYAYREMIVSLVRKELRGRYKGSVLGFLWTFINPLLQLVVYGFVFSLLARNQDIDNFYLFVFIGLVPWMFFSAALTGGAGSILASKEMIKKIYFPREIMPISYVTSAFVNMLLTFLIIFLVVFLTGTGFSVPALLCLPVIMLVEFVLAMGIALLSSALTVYFRDLEYILGIVSMAWMYMTPILYHQSLVVDAMGKWGSLYYLNPMTPIIIAYRDVLYYKRVPELSTLAMGAGLGIFFVIFGYAIFRRLQKGFAEEL